MKFYLSSSNFFDNYEDLIKNYPVLKNYKISKEGKYMIIEIDTLEELLNLMKDADKIIICD